MSSAASGLWINDRDVADFGFALAAALTGHADGPEVSATDVATQGWPGPLYSSEPTLAQHRTLSVPLHGQQATLALQLEAEDRLKALAYDGPVRLRFGDRPDQEYRDARCTGVTVARRGVPFAAAADLLVAFTLATPQRFAVQPTGVALSTARAACPIGTAPSAPVLVLHGNGGSLTNPTVTVRSAAGTVVQTMGLTGVLGASDVLRIDGARGFVSTLSDGVAAAAESWFTAGDFPLLRPADGWFEASAWPTVELSAAAGTPVGLLTYTKQYL